MCVYIYMHVCIPSWFSWSPTLCDPMGCSLPGSSVHGILQARILEWFTITSSRGSWESHLSIYPSTHTYIYVHIYVCENLDGQYNLRVYLEDQVWGKRWGCQDRIIGKQRWRPAEKFWLNVLCNLLKSWRVKTSRILFLTLISILIFKEVDNNVQRA